MSKRAWAVLAVAAGAAGWSVVSFAQPPVKEAAREVIFFLSQSLVLRNDALGYKSKDQFDAVTDGAVPLADTYMGPLRGVHPIFLLSSLPFLAKTIDLDHRDSGLTIEAQEPGKAAIGGNRPCRNPQER